MKNSEANFLLKLEELGKEQAHIEATSPLPEWARPVASLLGEKPLPTLFFGSLVLAALISVWFYPVALELFNRGVLSWLLR